MLVFRSGVWRNVDVALSDPIFTEGHRREAAAMIATAMERGISLVAAIAEAEKTLYLRLYSGLVMRKEHSTPENKKE
jgi:hypothetical protein